MYISGLRGLRDGAGGSAQTPTPNPCYYCGQFGGASGVLKYVAGKKTTQYNDFWWCTDPQGQPTIPPYLKAAPCTGVKAGPDAVVGVPGSRGGSSPTTPTGGTSTGVTPYAGGNFGTPTATAGKPCPIVPCARKPCPPCVPQPCEEQPCYETGDSGGQTDNRNMTGLRGMRGLRGCGCGGNCNRCRQASPCEWG